MLPAQSNQRTDNNRNTPGLAPEQCSTDAKHKSLFYQNVKTNSVSFLICHKSARTRGKRHVNNRKRANQKGT